MTITNHSTNECSLPDCFCHEAQRLARVATTIPDFEYDWNHAPSGRRRRVEQEDALYWYVTGGRAKEAELLELFNGDLRELIRIANERVLR